MQIYYNHVVTFNFNYSALLTWTFFSLFLYIGLRNFFLFVRFRKGENHER